MNHSLDTAPREFHVSRHARDRYEFDASLYQLNGNVVFADFHAVRVFAAKINAQRDLVQHPESAVKASHLNAAGLLDEVLHYVVAQYRALQPRVLELALMWLEKHLGSAAVDETLQAFCEQFPPVAVYQSQTDALHYLQSETQGVPNTQIALEELLMLWISNQNSALSSYSELLGDTCLKNTSYSQIINELKAFFETQPGFGPRNLNLIELLREPSLTHPESLFEQLDFVLKHWEAIAPAFLARLLTSLDFMREEEKPSFAGAGPSRVLDYQRGNASVGMDEPERFSEDRDWMPNVVLLAKNSYVWLDQLSKKYRREIKTLDAVPDEELDLLAARGFTGLWLIGLWERSRASQRVKQMCGNADAVASAYSLYSYDIAGNLGGEGAMHTLRERAGARGIRMASDMVPNHMAIDSRWVIEHPDWFLSVEHAPFPTYTFGGVNLSDDSRAQIYLEDHYYSRNDAAVVFKRVDSASGETRFIYHGNDGTSMPWNDTAQLNYLKAEVREAVIQTILHVARQFPIIRFDAAMTLAKRHYQRLWFPSPGSGGDIASRAEHGLSSDDFNALFPVEFWREVVDRVAVEAPDTLLLAEAFWMMEGFFVRSLGMHRVYNSAFMNMLRDEENAKYRQVLKNTLEFEPAILKRFVNFMNNPDEDTAVEQFGRGDKYFGVCTLMATLPGLPMFGHGQVEGLSEKYGMEYSRALWDETPDEQLINRHNREIFPLLHQRHLFADVELFTLYDFWNGQGGVNENVYAYSNGGGEDRVLVLFNNAHADAAGWVRSSVGMLNKNGGGLLHRTLGEALNLTSRDDRFVIFRDHNADLEYVRSSKDLCENGLFAQLQGYGYHVFMNWREVHDTTGRYAQIAAQLNGHGVQSIDKAVRELWLLPVLEPFRAVCDANVWRKLLNCDDAEENRVTEITANTDEVAPVNTAPVETVPIESSWREMEHRLRVLEREIRAFCDVPQDAKTTFVDETLARLETASPTPPLAPPLEKRRAETGAGAQIAQERNTNSIQEDALQGASISSSATQPRNELPSPFRREGTGVRFNQSSAETASLFAWSIVQDLGKIVKPQDDGTQSRAWLDEWLFADVLKHTLRVLDVAPDDAQNALTRVKILTAHSEAFSQITEQTLFSFVSLLISDDDVKRFVGVHRFENVVYFNREKWEDLLGWLLKVAELEVESSPHRVLVAQLEAAAQTAGYGVVKLLAEVRKTKAIPV